MALKSSKINFPNSILVNALTFLGFSGSWKFNFQNSIRINALTHYQEKYEKNIHVNLSKLFADMCEAALEALMGIP